MLTDLSLMHCSLSVSLVKKDLSFSESCLMVDTPSVVITLIFETLQLIQTLHQGSLSFP
jgi:hypothetical protein